MRRLRNKAHPSWLICAAAVLALNTSHAAYSLNCENLRDADTPAIRVLESQWVKAGNALPAHCRVHGLLPTAVHFELRLPEPWNGKSRQVGSGGNLGMCFDQSYELSRG